MNKIISLILSFVLVLPLFSIAVTADEEVQPAQNEFIYDDCADFGKAAASSDGLSLDVVTEDNKYAFGGDDTHIIRVTDTEEWLVYETDPNGYFVFNTCFSPSEPVSDFKFEYSSDNENWTEFSPIITRKSVESYKWIPISYSLKKLPRDAKYIKVLFQNIGGIPWSPCIESVELHPHSSNELGFNDCIGTKYYNPTKKLKCLGLVSGYSKSEFNPDGTITRAEFCTMMAKLININTLISANDFRPVFGDINSDYWASGAIYAMYSLGVINGDENKNFNPEDNITYKDAVKILVSVLGYTPIAEGEGGYPSGFMITARRLGMTDDIELDDNDLISRGDSAMLMSNSLDIEIMKQSTFGGQNVYGIDGSTVLSAYYDIYEKHGVLTEVGCASVYAGQTAADNELVIGGEKIKDGGLNVYEYLGMSVTAYVLSNNQENTVVYIEPDSSNMIIDIDYNLYDRIDGNSLYFTDNSGDERHVSLSGDTKIIYNYKYSTRVALIDSLDIKCGRIKVISNDGNSSADYIMVFDYDTYFVENETRLSGVLQDKFAGAVDLKLNEADCIMLINDGDTAAYDENYIVPSNTVICAAKSDDGQIFDIRIITDTANGIVTNINSSNDECVINGSTYKLSEYFVSSGRTIEPSDKPIRAYLDMNNNIVYVSDSSSVEEYGYLQAVSAEDAFGSGVLLRIITGSGKAEEYRVTAKSQLNGSSSSVNAFSVLSPQLIRFTLRSDGSIASLYTAEDTFGEVKEEAFARNFVSDSAKYYGDGLNIFASKYQLSSDTKIFVVPYDVTNISKYEVISFSGLLSDTAYNVELFDLSYDYKAGAAVIRQNTDDGTIYNYSPVGVIVDSGTCVTNDGEKYLSLKLFIDGIISELKFSPDGAADKTDGWLNGYHKRKTNNGFNPFSAGEVIQFAVKNDVCCAFRMLLTADKITDGELYESNLGDYGALSDELFYSEMYTALGRIERKFSDKVFLCGDTENNRLRSIPLSSSNVYVYNMRTHKITLGNNTDIESGGRMFVYLRFSTVPLMLVIYE